MNASPFFYIGGNNMYNNPYMNQFNSQVSIDRINEQINNLEKMKSQIQQPTQQPAINQTFQLAPTNNHALRYANTINDVVKEQVFYDTPFFSKDMTVMWFKNAKGDIKSYELNEIVPKDSKDFEIEYLKTQIEELKGMIKNDANVTDDDTEQDTTDTTGDDETDGTTIKKNKPSSISKVSNGKKK